MDKEMITLFFCAGIVIAAAIIVTNYFIVCNNKKIIITQRNMFILGSNLAKIGWSKVSPNPVDKDLLCSTTSLLCELNFSDELKRELEHFANHKESIKELQESLPRIKGIIAMQLASRFGRKNVGYYNIGFNVINVSPILEHASMNIDEAGKIAAESIHGIEGDASTLGLPTNNLKVIRKLVDRGLFLHKIEAFSYARSGLIKVGQNYIDILEGN